WKQCLPRSTPISDTVSMMVLQKDKILTQRSPLSEDRADHPIKHDRAKNRMATPDGARRDTASNPGIGECTL
ncbi:hypothetical protein, partial [Burkholderia orbicola]|uniref:hypothetical protein n=1 Tax=Burkholderia orbicola TaxID=2978683 RepID=UPI00264C459D